MYVKYIIILWRVDLREHYNFCFTYLPDLKQFEQYLILANRRTLHFIIIIITAIKVYADTGKP